MSNREIGVETGCEQALTHALMDVACELRLIDIADIVAYVRGDRMGNLFDLVSSSIELYFRPGTLNFACMAEVRSSWAKPPLVEFELDFACDGVAANFNLGLDPWTFSVELRRLRFSGDASAETSLPRFAAALEKARIASPKPRPPTSHGQACPSIVSADRSLGA